MYFPTYVRICSKCFYLSLLYTYVCKHLIVLGVNQRVASQLEVVPVLLQLLRNELLDTSQKLCIVMCLAVLSEGNSERSMHIIISANHKI